MKTHCSKGHALTEDNLIKLSTGNKQYRMTCKVCRLRIARESAQRNYIPHPKPQATETHCVHGHELTDNAYLSGDKRACKTCAKERSRATYHNTQQELATLRQQNTALRSALEAIVNECMECDAKGFVYFDGKPDVCRYCGTARYAIAAQEGGGGGE